MTTKLDQLEHEIALAERAAAEATKANYDAGVELAWIPSSPEALKAAREAAQKLAAAEADLEMLRKARVAAKAADTAEAEAAARTKAIGHLEAVERLQAERMRAAAKIDKIMDTLKAACADWKSLSAELRGEATGFFRLTVNGRGAHDYAVGSVVGDICGALAAEMDTATSGMDAHNSMRFQYLRPQVGQPVLATDAVQCSGNVLLTRMREVAKQQGLLQ